MQQVLSFSLPLPLPSAPPKLERKHFDDTVAAPYMKLKQSPIWWSVHRSSDWWVVLVLKKEKGGGCELERRYAAKS